MYCFWHEKRHSFGNCCDLAVRHVERKDVVLKFSVGGFEHVQLVLVK